MPAPILYCGDTNLEGAASYLAGLMTHFDWAFDYVPSHVPMTRELIERPHSLLILSDYPATQFDDELQEIALKQVEGGMGLLMIGGWESFRGFGGDWDVAPLAKAIPVEMSINDDRVNFSQPTLLFTDGYKKLPNEPEYQGLNEAYSIHQRIVGGLPWLESPPTIGGLNSVKLNRSHVAWHMLFARSFSIRWNEEGTFWQAIEESIYPALVVGKQQSGRTAAFMSDVAPHWVGGFVDWGPKRVKAQAAGASAVEVGSYYAQFWKQLLSWVGRLE